MSDIRTLCKLLISERFFVSDNLCPRELCNSILSCRDLGLLCLSLSVLLGLALRFAWPWLQILAIANILFVFQTAGGFFQKSAGEKTFRQLNTVRA